MMKCIYVAGMLIYGAAGCAPIQQNPEQPFEQRLISKCNTVYDAMTALAGRDINWATYVWLEETETNVDVLCSPDGPITDGVVQGQILLDLEGYLEDVVARQNGLEE